jgi:hypothetical protein
LIRSGEKDHGGKPVQICRDIEKTISSINISQRIARCNEVNKQQQSQQYDKYDKGIPEFLAIDHNLINIRS